MEWLSTKEIFLPSIASTLGTHPTTLNYLCCMDHKNANRKTFTNEESTTETALHNFSCGCLYVSWNVPCLQAKHIFECHPVSHDISRKAVWMLVFEKIKRHYNLYGKISKLTSFFLVGGAISGPKREWDSWFSACSSFSAAWCRGHHLINIIFKITRLNHEK